MADDSADRKRHKLTLMPEVLPDPLRAGVPAAEGSCSSAGSAVATVGAPTNARARTLEHMRRMIASATTTAVLVGCSSGDTASPDTAGKDPAKSAAPSATATASASVGGNFTQPPGSATATTPPVTTNTGTGTTRVQPTTPPIPSTPGYIVVDPMPTPTQLPPLPSGVPTVPGSMVPTAIPPLPPGIPQPKASK
ncbi:MAG: hypothetical protein U0271_26015 [Polyangiaceae bacterium]